MPKIKIYEDEVWPWYNFDTNLPYGTEVEVSEEKLYVLEKAREAVIAYQEYLRELYANN